MAKRRVLVVDDSALLRRLIGQVVASDPGNELIGSARSGKEALELIAKLKPDIITLDVEMPEMDGLQTLKALRQRWRRLPVIMVSAHTKRGASATLDALALGASDYVAKPAGSNLQASLRMLSNDLLPRIQRLVRVQRPQPVAQRPATPVRPGSTAQPAARPSNAQRRPPRSSSWSPRTPIKAILIGSSTGGPQALATVLTGIKNLPVPMLIVQHMPTIFTAMLAERLNKQASFTVREGQTNERVVPGTAWIAPGGFHMVPIKQGNSVILQTNENAKENSCRPAVDVTLRAAAKIWGPSLLVVILTGMGRDGCAETVKIHRLGAPVIAQDEESSVVWGMPGSVVRAGASDLVVPLEKVADTINKLIQRRSLGPLGLRS